MFDYMTVQETAKLWGISERQVQKLCKANRIEGVIHLTRVWLIPRYTEKPADMRRKNY
ncbi:MAG: helix-turn-helix domain-containing protein [Lachnospiraceae bacterium]|jgi:hypothetical protein|uniref:helix-turn-helix domain-containing protein n=1 Tax=Hominisplanchenecus murintestinalis TaxID=2941517 RepID=UPI000EA1932C|nr:helix-turn-helix domain-containing protein [Hominisplanchenecus murintestinalis]MCI9660656.1 helix-turn-helix domain-containing protein [Lachnospiraceae bacterium]NBH99205.1 DNA-binding protein [Lachnospiraceae bacterium]NBI76462.1 DNA-binding protein [Lachnospiraceae bacterium]RKJ79972.1 DNA-binding protein [Anaerotruncus sp. 1XD22-93]